MNVVLTGPLGRSRCGEPDLRDFAQRSVLARGTTTLAALRRARTTVRLDRGGFDVSSPAGRARLRPDLTVTVSRVAGG